MMLLEENEIILKHQDTANVFNTHFANIVDSLDLYNWPDNIQYDNDIIDQIIRKYNSHPSIQNIKQHIKIGDPFSFSPVTEEHVQDIILKLKCDKATGGDIQ